METIVTTPDITLATVSDIAVQYSNAIDVLTKYKIDYCCGGNKSFIDACRQAELEPKKVMEEIFQAEAQPHSSLRFNQWQPPLLVDFILQNHHSYVKESIPQIKELLDKVCIVHGEEEPNLYEVKKNFEALSIELLQHMLKEEQVLFPAINNLYTLGQPFSIGLEQPIMVMEDEHEHAGALVKSIRTLTNNYTPPAFACPTFQVTYKLLKEFDDDLMHHIHLENNILFKKVKQHQHLSTL
jgi:regulator of cell morphogenesis and NO signaling